MDVPNLLKHVINDTIDRLCRMCLSPLEDLYEDVFTKICKENYEYCVADILQEVCHIKIDKFEEFKVCPKCFVTASEMYRFYIQTLANQETLNFYVDKLNSQLDMIPKQLDIENLCISLPPKNLQIKTFNYDIHNHPFKKLSDLNEHQKSNKLNQIMKVDRKETKNVHTKKKKQQRNRGPMEYKVCSKCPVRYRFVSKLQEHMKEEHGVTLFVCKVCGEFIEDEKVYKIHLSTHTGFHTCEQCNLVFKKHSSLIKHLEWHKETTLLNGDKKQSEIYVCETCGTIVSSKEDLAEHMESKHACKHTCYYCGRRYKMQLSFELHIKKHELYLKGDLRNKEKVVKTVKKNFTCSECGRNFVDERSLLWHARLHAGEKPYECNTCGRRFVSINRRNQHALCSHTAPTRQCPLCPALFHLRSMVNTHIKRVHLRKNKRRNRLCKKRDVFWKTETVPLQELSVSLQNEVLKLKAENN